MIWSPIRISGLSAVIGSWNTIAMRLPRRRRSRAAPTLSTFSPWSRISPAEGVKMGGRSPITALAVTDLPEPDSPTTQTISPGATSRLKPSMALARSAPRGSGTVSPRMERTGSVI